MYDIINSWKTSKTHFENNSLIVQKKILCKMLSKCLYCSHVSQSFHFPWPQYERPKDKISTKEHNHLKHRGHIHIMSCSAGYICICLQDQLEKATSFDENDCHIPVNKWEIEQLCNRFIFFRKNGPLLTLGISVGSAEFQSAGSQDSCNLVSPEQSPFSHLSALYRITSGTPSQHHWEAFVPTTINFFRSELEVMSFFPSYRSGKIVKKRRNVLQSISVHFWRTTSWETVKNLRRRL